MNVLRIVLNEHTGEGQYPAIGGYMSEENAPVWNQSVNSLTSGSINAWADLDIIVWDVPKRIIHLPPVVANWLIGINAPVDASPEELPRYLDLASQKRFAEMQRRIKKGLPLKKEYRIGPSQIRDNLREMSVRPLQIMDAEGQPSHVIGLLNGLQLSALINYRIDQQHAALTQLATSNILHANDAQAAYQAISKSLAHMINCSRVSIWFFDESGDYLTCAELYEREQNRHSAGYQLERSRYPAYFSALNEGHIVVASDAHTDHRTRDFKNGYLEAYDIQSMMDVLIQHDGQAIGVMCCEHVGRMREWRTDEKLFATSLAAMLTVHIESRQRRLTEQALSENEKRYKTLFDSAGEAILLVTRDGKICDGNLRSHRLFKTTREHLIGSCLYQWLPATHTDAQGLEQSLQNFIVAGLMHEGLTFEWQFDDPKGQRRDIEIRLSQVLIGGTPKLLMLLRDVSEIKSNLATIEHQINHDQLTNLPNRYWLTHELDRLIADHTHNHPAIALLVLNLNHFKEINNTLGHEIGDLLLRQLAERLATTVKPNSDSLVRLGGDEFAIILQGGVSESKAFEIGNRINTALAIPFDLQGNQLPFEASIGIALCQPGMDTEQLLRCADVAMREAKRTSVHTCCYDQSLDMQMPKQLALISELRIAIDAQHLEVYFQPKIDLAKNTLRGFEALVRWPHAEQGMISPANFIPLAEMTNLIHPLTDQVIELTLKQWNRWADQGFRIPIAVNLSTRNLLNNDCPDRIEQLLNKYQVPARFLELEITESALIADPDRALLNARRIDAIGVQLTIDDFGTGYSSLGYLKSLPVSTLKIDMSFIRNMVTDRSDYKIVQSTIRLAHSLGMNVVAEGAANDETITMLRRMDCDYVQGEFYSMPVAPKQISIEAGYFHIDGRQY